MEEQTSNQPYKCYLCGQSEIEKIEGRVRNDESLDVLRCKNCSLVFLSSFEHICDCFYEENGMFGGSKIETDRWLQITKNDDDRRFNFLKKTVTGKKILDFGCGNGGFLSRAKASAQKVVGIEVQKSLQEFYDQNNLEIYADIEQVKNKFDLITMFHVLEHIKDPINLLKKLESKLTANGEIIIEIPNSNDALISIYKNKAFMDFTYWSCHLYLFNEKTLSTIIKKAGYKINYLKHVQRYGVANHLWWQVKKKPGGHNKLNFLNCKFLNKLYENVLASKKATDTIIASISK